MDLQETSMDIDYQSASNSASSTRQDITSPRPSARNLNEKHFSSDSSSFGSTPKNGSSQKMITLGNKENHVNSQFTKKVDALPDCFRELLNETNFCRVNHTYLMKLGEIGKGTNSKIFKVLTSDGSLYALKQTTLPPHDPVLQEYSNEVKILERLRNCEYIINMIDYEIDERSGNFSILLELGTMTLESLLKQEKIIHPNQLRYIWQQMLRAVEAIHQEKIIHGNLQPSHFLFVKGVLKLIDFGIAKTIEGDKTSTIIGTIIPDRCYLAPEVFKGKVRTTSDVFSLGVMLYELVYKVSPFPYEKMGIVGNYDKLFLRHPAFPDFDFIKDTLLKCLQRNHDHRPSASDLLTMPYLNHSTIFWKTTLSVEDNLKQLAKLIQRDYLDTEFSMKDGKQVISVMSSQLFLGVPMKIEKSIYRGKMVE